MMAEGKTNAGDTASAHRILRGQKPWYVRTTLVPGPGFGLYTFTAESTESVDRSD